MKKLLVLFILIPFFSNAQLLGGNNVIKVNLPSIAFGNYHITYERALLKKLSISVSYRFMPKRVVPLAGLVEKSINVDDIKLGDFYMANNAFTPEIRLYPVKKLKGFYLAAYGRFADFDLSVPVKYTASSLPGNPTEYATFEGKIKSSSIGLMIGTQFNLGKKIILDWWIIGGHYGSSNGDLLATTQRSLSPLEQQSLQSTLDGFETLGPFKFEGKVRDDRHADIKSVGPWAGIRGMGLSLGFRF